MHGRSLVRQRPAWQRRGRFSVDGGRSRVVADECTRQHKEGEGDMKTSLFSLATAVLLASSVHAAILPPANNWKSSLTDDASRRSEEHTSELQSLAYLVCRLLLDKKKIRLAA